MEYSEHEFGPEFEESVLNVILTEPKFVEKFRPIISEEAFILDNNKYIIKTISEYFDKYGRPPSTDILKDVVRKGLFRDKGGVLKRITDAATVPDVEYVRDKLLSWVKWRAIDQVFKSHNGDLPHEFASRIEKASRIGDELVMEHTKLDDVEKETIRGEIIETPWSWLNNQLSGGPEIGDLAVVLTVISGGKTTALVNITRHALSLGKFVVYFTFEDGEIKIKRRLTQSICNITRDEILANPTQVIKRRNRFLKKHDGRCEIKDLQSRRSTVSEAASFIKTVEEINGRKVDLVVTDYADRFRPTNRYNEPRHALREIFEDCKWLAMHLNVIHWTARQVNKTRVGKEIISADAAGESWGSMESPDLVIGLGRTMEDEERDLITLYTAKVRDDKDHKSTSLITDFAKQRIVETSNVGSRGILL